MAIGETAVLPPGPYLFEVVNCDKEKMSQGGWLTARFVVELLGTTFRTFWWLSKGHPDWRVLMDDWNPYTLEGCVFLFEVRIEPFNEQPRMVLSFPLAEVVG